MSQREMTRHFRRQVKALHRERPDGFLVETMTSLTEAEAAVLAVREFSRKKLICSMTFPEGLPKKEAKRSVEPLQLISSTLRKAGADLIGYNCGTHPQEAFDFLNLFRTVDPGPWAARPAAGTPTRPVPPEVFVKWVRRILALGVSYIGGCCGTTPAYIRAVREDLDKEV